MSRKPAFWMVVATNALVLCVLGFYRNSPAAPGGQTLPFGDSGAQRTEIVEQLKQVNRLLRQQNVLLESGRLTVVLTDKKEK